MTSCNTNESTGSGPEMSEDNNENLFIGIECAAHYLGITPRSLRDFEMRGIIPACRLGRSVRFNLRVLDKYLIANRMTTLEELENGSSQVPPGPIGPLLPPNTAAEYLGLKSARSLIQRVYRMQIPAYRVSERTIRFRKCELDNCLLTGIVNNSTVDYSACLPELGRR
ncbi:MAG: helix-turn-helix domain-containing protein [Proteobacteria bacterium]|nr:helix-turn-helix domain-containing protein [Pseudomonadota bacterium]